jgi:short-subunit dehydrogenase
VTVVNGCDSGISKAFASEFHRRRLERRRARRQRRRQHRRLPGRLAAHGVRVEVLVDNAGFGAMGSGIEMPLADVRRQYDVNIFGLLATAQALAEGMRQAGRGTTVNVGPSMPA